MATPISWQMEPSRLSSPSLNDGLVRLPSVMTAIISPFESMGTCASALNSTFPMRGRAGLASSSMLFWRMSLSATGWPVLMAWLASPISGVMSGMMARISGGTPLFTSGRKRLLSLSTSAIQPASVSMKSITRSMVSLSIFSMSSDWLTTWATSFKTASSRLRRSISASARLRSVMSLTTTDTAVRPSYSMPLIPASTGSTVPSSLMISPRNRSMTSTPSATLRRMSLASGEVSTASRSSYLRPTSSSLE